MWTVVYTADAIKTLSRLDSVAAKRIRTKIVALARNLLAPNNNVKRLTGMEGYRLRVGDWRVVYTLKHETVTVIIVRIGHRSEVYG